MAHLLNEHTRVVPTWLAACNYLDAQPDREGRNLVLEIPAPSVFTVDDREVIKLVDAAIRQHDNGLSIETVANTIFPEGLYRRHGRPGFYERYELIMERAKKPGTWGTYALRLIARGQGRNKINPLEIIIGKLKRASTEGYGYRSAYEAGFIDPQTDLGDPSLDFGCELPTYDPGVDARKILNMPCLSHLSFKLFQGTHVDLTAIYRSHYYCKRALGNLIGLSRLMAFVAKEAELEVGTMTCVSTHANLDVIGWGGAAESGAILKASTDKIGQTRTA